MFELQLNAMIKKFQSNWGGRFQSFSSFFAQSGIISQTSCPAIHE